ncbi:hypothetical protein GGQ05_001348 [Salinibacter ruber]|nr:hypothetical protein [Salinibacter ruber]
MKRSVGDVFYRKFADVPGVIASLKVLNEFVELAGDFIGKIGCFGEIFFVQVPLVVRDDQLGSDLSGRGFGPAQEVYEPGTCVAFKSVRMLDMTLIAARRI